MSEGQLFTNRKRQEDLPLTQLEEKYMWLSCEGLTIQEIAKSMFRAYQTVRTELSYCYRKLRARNRVHATAIFIKLCYLREEIQKKGGDLR